MMKAEKINIANWLSKAKAINTRKQYFGLFMEQICKAFKHVLHYV